MNQFTFDSHEDHKISAIAVSASSWSPKRDLLALGSEIGEILLYRLQMTLIWKVNVKNEGSVTSLCWHPDGNIFVVSFSSGLLQYYSMFHANSLYQIKYEQSVHSMQWISINSDQYLNEESQNNLYNIMDIFPLRNTLSHNSVYKEEIKRLEEIISLNVKLSLLIGISGFSIFFLARGLYNLGYISLEDLKTSSTDRLLTANLSPHADSLSFTLQVYNEKGDQIIRTHMLNCGFVRENLSQISNTSSLIVDIVHLRLLLQLQMKEIEESWEDCLNDFEKGILDYSKKKEHLPNWSLRTDFMEMILFGCCNKEFWTTLEKSLNTCWFKQIYDRMTKMSDHISNHCCPNMHLTLLKLFFHCNEIGNVVRSSSEYGILFISKEDITNIIDMCSGTLLKLHEFQAVLEDNMKNLKLFFQWISNGLDNHVGDSNTFQSFSYSELSTIVDFITHKLKVVKNKRNEVISYKIEVVHQYLVEDDLTYPQLIDNQDFLLNLFKEITDDGPETIIDGIFHIRNEKSLTNMAGSILPNLIDRLCWDNKKLFIKRNCSLSDSYSLTLAAFPYINEDNKIMISDSYIDDSDSGVVEVYALYDPGASVLIWFQNQIDSLRSCVIHLDSINNQDKKYTKISKMQFYNSNTLIALISVEKDDIVENCFLMVLLWSHFEENHFEKIRVHSHLDSRDELFSIWPSEEYECIKLSGSLIPGMLEIIPNDAVDIVISCSRDLALVFFGKTYERCRIFVLNDE